MNLPRFLRPMITSQPAVGWRNKRQHFKISRHASPGRTIFVADAHRHDGKKRFVVRADEKLTAFMELESVIGASN